MKPAPFLYDAARDLDHAISLFNSVEGEAKYIAGGQTLGPMLNLRLTQPDHLIDISRLEALRVCTDDGTSVILGAGLRHAEIEDGHFPDPSAGLMPRAAQSLAYRAVRNRGTIGGSVSYADPAAEWPNILSALEASVMVHGLGGKREIPIGTFFMGYLTIALEQGEIVSGLRVPVLGQGARVGYHKLCRQPGEYAEALAITVKYRSGAARCVLGCAGPVPLVLRAVSDMAASMPKWQGGARAELAQALAQDFHNEGIEADELEHRTFTTVIARSLRDALT